MTRAAGVLAVVLLVSCRGGETPKAPARAEAAEDIATPVQIATVVAVDREDVVAGPGRTAVLSQQKVRAPFAGTLVALTAADGDILRRGQIVGAIVSRESEAALAGAREMSRDAETPAQRTDAARALALAEKNLVRKNLTASAGGPVLSHAAASGDRVTEDQEILTIADASSTVFVADVPQDDLARVRPGQGARIALAGRTSPLAARVHAILPGANPADFSGSVRIDFPAMAEKKTIGLFGTARITVGRRPGVLVAPDAAVLRDDVHGTSQVAAVVRAHAHWIPVRAGDSQDGRVEISGPGVAPGLVVIVSGMVGLPEGKSVAAAPPGPSK